MAGRVSLKDIAAETGVSISTVSLALSGDRRVTPATRDLVRAAAARLGYVRDPLLASLAAGRFRHAGKPARIAVDISTPVWTARLKQQAEVMGMTVAGCDGPVDTLQARALEQGFAALVLNRRGVDVRGLAGSALPTVLWEDEGPATPPVDLVETCEWWTATSGAIERVRAAGFTRPAAVLTPAQPRHWHDDIRLACARTMGVPVFEWQTEASTPAAAAFLAEQRADAVIAGLPHIHEHLHRQGVHLPLAVLLVHAGEWFAGFTGWLPDQDHRGQVTLELIEQRLRYGPRPPRRIVVPPRWQDGKTLSARG